MKKIKLGGHRKGSSTKGYALVDDSNFLYLNSFKWTVNNNGYPITRGKNNQKGNLIFMHHLVYGKKPIEKIIDHIDRNPLNNKIDNLRLADKSTNGANRGLNKNNTSGYKGVCWSKSHNKWVAYIKVNRIRKHLGLFTDIREAISIYNKEAVKHFKEYAYTN